MRCDFVDVFVLCWWEASATYVPTLWLLYTCLRLRHVMTASSPIGWNPMTSCKPCHRGCILYVYTCSYRLLIWSNFVDDESWHARLDTMQVHATDYSWVQRVVDSTCSSDVTRLKTTRHVVGVFVLHKWKATRPPRIARGRRVYVTKFPSTGSSCSNIFEAWLNLPWF